MLGPEVQGEWNLYISAYILGTLALGFGLPPALNHFLAAGKIEKEDLLGQLFLFSVLVAVVFLVGSTALFYTSLGRIVFPQTLSARILLVGLSIHFLLLMFNQLMTAILLAEKKFRATAIVTTIGSIFLLAGYAFFYFFQQNSPPEYFILFIVLNLVVLSVQSFLLVSSIVKIGRYGFRLRFFSRSMFLLLFSFAALAYLTNFLQFLSYRMDLWFVNAFETNEAQLGIYAAAVSLGQLIWLIPNAFHSIIFTDVSFSSGNEDYVKKIGLWAWRLLLMAMLMAMVGYGLSQWLIVPIFGEDYTGIIEVFPYLLPGIVLFAPAILWSAYFAGINRVDINLWASLMGFVTCIVLDFALIPKFSILGAAIASSISYAVSSVYLYIRFNRQLH